MKRNEYKILKREIPDVNLHSLTGQYWFEYSNQWLPWVSGSVVVPGMTPSTDERGNMHLVHDVKWYSDITYDLDDTLFYSGKTYISLKNSNLNHIPSAVSSSYWNEIEERSINNTKGKYYKWNGSTWVLYTGPLGFDYVIPIALEADADEMGVMTSFDGNMEQVEQLVNFTYKVSGSHVTIYSTVNPDKLRKIVDQDFTIDWGVKQNITGSLSITGSLDSNGGVLYSNFPTASFNYTPYTSSFTGSYKETYTGSNISSFDISIFLNSPWSNQKITKKITIFNTGSITDNVDVFGICTGFTIPSNGSNLNYLNDYEYATGYTATPSKPFKFMAIGQSKIGDFKRYGETTPYGVDSGSLSDGTKYTGYTVNELYYMDREDGFTQITGSVPNYRFGPTSGYTYEITGNTINTVPYITTNGNTTEFEAEYEIIDYIIQHRLTRNEHFIGFIDDPTVYSDIFVERGRQGIMEVNLRLGEIDNMDELDIYGNGYFKVRKQ
jgi:hypothetical protein